MPEDESHTSHDNSNADQNTLKDSADVTDETMDIEGPGFNDVKNPLPMEPNHQPTSTVNPIQTISDDIQPILQTNVEVRGTDASKMENSLPSIENERSSEEQPENISKSASSAYLPSTGGLSLENRPLTQDENSISETVQSTYLPAGSISMEAKPISQVQDVPRNVNNKASKLVEQHMAPPKPKSTDATKMNYSPYVPQSTAASADGDESTILKTSPAIYARTHQAHASNPSQYFPLVNQANETASFELSESTSQAQSNGNVASENRFSPIKKAEVVEKDTFQPTIRKASTNQYRAFKPLESDADKYNDVIEDESDDDNMSTDEAKNRKEEKRM